MIVTLMPPLLCGRLRIAADQVRHVAEYLLGQRPVIADSAADQPADLHDQRDHPRATGGWADRADAGHEPAVPHTVRSGGSRDDDRRVLRVEQEPWNRAWTLGCGG